MIRFETERQTVLSLGLLSAALSLALAGPALVLAILA
jgi:hypothetical protein